MSKEVQIERTFKQQVERWSDPQRDFFIKHLPKFEGPTEGLETLKVEKGISDERWNFQLPRPLVDNETVHVHPDQSGVGDQYVRIVMSSPIGPVSSVFNRHRFQNKS